MIPSGTTSPTRGGRVRRAGQRSRRTRPGWPPPAPSAPAQASRTGAPPIIDGRRTLRDTEARWPAGPASSHGSACAHGLYPRRGGPARVRARTGMRSTRRRRSRSRQGLSRGRSTRLGEAIARAPDLGSLLDTLRAKEQRRAALQAELAALDWLGRALEQILQGRRLDVAGNSSRLAATRIAAHRDPTGRSAMAGRREHWWALRQPRAVAGPPTRFPARATSAGPAERSGKQPWPHGARGSWAPG